ncbi:hypothetical protein A2U01_0097748, partial [Trifolium medium]|nr:hypothetical protein [Trifolium medium]
DHPELIEGVPVDNAKGVTVDNPELIEGVLRELGLTNKKADNFGEWYSEV